MAEYTASALQTVGVNQNILFSDTAVCGNCSILHREGSGLVTLRGLTRQCRARFRITFGGNLSVPATGTARAISIAISTNGEPVNSTVATVTPAAVNELFNVSTSIFLDVPVGCCSQVSVTNISDQPINVTNANLIVERVA